jgi:L-asparaginase/Glu-tRNA(Gln) amidotransferase subunit D
VLSAPVFAEAKWKFSGVEVKFNAKRSHKVRNDNTSSERAEEFKYLGTVLTNQNYIQKEIKSKLKSGNAFFHSMQNICLLVCYPEI